MPGPRPAWTLERNPMRSFRFRSPPIRAFPIALILLVAAGSGCLNRSRWSANPDQPAAFADYWEYTLRRHPERATYLGDHRYDDKLHDYSERARR
ncbi:MAG: hypothetical protein ACE5EC_08975, partial [Phycisphaerae bacterium]